MKTKLLVIAVIITIIASAVGFIACSPTEAEGETAYVRIAVNPEIELAVGEDNLIEAVVAANEDAEILLSDTELVGLSVEEAAEEFLDMALEAGYIDEEAENTEVEIEVIGEETKDEDAIKNRLRERINRFFNNNGIFGSVSEATLEQYAEQAAELGVSTGKTKMILKALDADPELDIQELKDMEMKDLVKLFKEDASCGLDATIKEQYRTERTAIQTQYGPLIEAAEAELEQLRAQLEAYAGEEEGRAELEASIEAKAAELKLLEDQYKEAKDELCAECNAEREQLKVQQRARKQQRIAEHNAAKAENNGKSNGSGK